MRSCKQGYAEDCRAPGFEMDCGNSFAEAFPGPDRSIFKSMQFFLLNFLFGGSDVVFKSADEFAADLRSKGQGGRKKLIRETPEIGENL